MKICKFIIPVVLLSLTACSTGKGQFSAAKMVPVIESQSETKESASGETASNSSESEASDVPNISETVQTGLIREQILNGTEGEIHYSYYLPEGYDGTRKYPMMVTMPGYDRMWFGEDSSGNNIEWSGFRAWTELDEDMIVISAQLTDWHEKIRAAG